MLVFGLITSVFDYLTFAVLIWLHANVGQFRTGWFIESIVSAALIVLVVRSRRPFFKSRPSKLLRWPRYDSRHNCGDAGICHLPARSGFSQCRHTSI